VSGLVLAAVVLGSVCALAALVVVCSSARKVETARCPDCDGFGWVETVFGADLDCRSCGGTGRRALPGDEEGR
jgi:hypothetical protein